MTDGVANLLVVGEECSNSHCWLEIVLAVPVGFRATDKNCEVVGWQGGGADGLNPSFPCMNGGCLHNGEHIRLALNAHLVYELIPDTSLRKGEMSKRTQGCCGWDALPFGSARVGGMDLGIRM